MLSRKEPSCPSYFGCLGSISLRSGRDRTLLGIVVMLMLAFGSSNLSGLRKKSLPLRLLPPMPRIKIRTKPRKKRHTFPRGRACGAEHSTRWQSAALHGHSGKLPVIDNGKRIGEVVFTAYIMEGQDRPVTFALNGGPGVASVYLNFGAIGPKHIEFGREGDSPSDPPKLSDNPGTWLDFTDLVFIDRSAPVTAGRWLRRRRSKKQFTVPMPTFITSRASFTIG